jgi:hypothetical protein
MSTQARTREVAMLSMRPFEMWIASTAVDTWNVRDSKSTAATGAHAFGYPGDIRGRSSDYEVNV